MSVEQCVQDEMRAIKVITEKRRDKLYIPIPPYVRFTSIYSKIDFEKPVKDYKGGENKSVELISHMCFPNQNEVYWSIHLNDERGVCISGDHSFARLPGLLTDFSPERLRRWQEEGEARHNRTLKGIEDAFYNSDAIPKNICER